MSWLDDASDNDVLLLVGGMIPMPVEERAESEVAGLVGGESGTRDWTEWDLEHRPLSHALQHLHEQAQRFHDSGGTVEALNGREHGDRLRSAEHELVALQRGLVKANGGNPLPDRVTKGFQLAHIALSNGRANHTATVHIARTADGHIAAVSTSHPRGMGNGLSHHLALMGSTGIVHGAGSALLREVMRTASEKNQRVTIVPYDREAANHWSGNLAAHEDEVSGDMGWTPDEVRQLAAA